MTNAKKKKIFISYSHKDEDWLDNLFTFLRRLELYYDIDIWSDTKIDPGANWREEIDKAIQSANIALLLISEDFLASDFIAKNELPPLLKKAEEKGMFILPLHLRPSSFKLLNNINQFQSLNSPDEPLSRLLSEHERDEELVEVVTKIEGILNKLESITEPVDELPEIEALTPSDPDLLENLSEQRVLIFDIDGTVLQKDENLADKNKEKFLDLFEFFIQKGFYIVFITGNDYSLQKRRVLQPIIERNLAASVTCFSDGGTRLFEYNGKDYEEFKPYSNQNEIKRRQVEIIEQEFRSALGEFMESPRHRQITSPDITELDRAYKQGSIIRYLDLIIFPLKPSFYETRFDEFVELIDNRINEFDIPSVYQIMDKYRFPNALVLRLRGPHADKDAELIRSEMNSIFRYWEGYTDIAMPEIEKRGGSDFTSQIALKPFKVDRLRRRFLEIIKSKLERHKDKESFSVLFGGKTTIDIQLKGVNKRKAIIQLIKGTKKFNPQKMIYFGDEFFRYGNDLAIALMEETFRPARIIHVGKKEETPEVIKNYQGFFVDGNGPNGTLNYLDFLRYELI